MCVCLSSSSTLDERTRFHAIHEYLNALKKGFSITAMFTIDLGVKVRNMKMDFNTGGTWPRVG